MGELGERSGGSTQLVLPDTTSPAKVRRGGRRKGAGRKRTRPGQPGIRHVRRPPHDRRHPIHVTLRARGDLPSLRSQMVERLIRQVLLRQKTRAYENGFQVVHFSIQVTHLHLIVEAMGPALRSGISGFVISFARRLNRLLQRSGKVWGDRYHRVDLENPTQVRNALRYVLQNWKKHSIVKAQGFVDPYSSGGRFLGWSTPVERVWQDTEPWPTYACRTWLLAEGWRKAGGLHVDDHPRSRRR